MNAAPHQTVPASQVPDDAMPDNAMIVDAGPTTLADLTSRLSDLRTLVWNGPLGAFETPCPRARFDLDHVAAAGFA